MTRSGMSIALGVAAGLAGCSPGVPFDDPVRRIYAAFIDHLANQRQCAGGESGDPNQQAMAARGPVHEHSGQWSADGQGGSELRERDRRATGLSERRRRLNRRRVSGRPGFARLAAAGELRPTAIETA